jgi:hypothetical protein
VQESGKKRLYFFIVIVVLYILAVAIDANAWKAAKTAFLYRMLSKAIFLFWTFYIIYYFVILLDIKGFFKKGLFIAASVVFSFLTSSFYYFIIALFLFIFKRDVFKNTFTILSVVFILSANFYYTMLYTGLGSDEEMITHFKEHRAEIEELIKRYREFDPQNAPGFTEERQENGEYKKVPYYARHLWEKQGDTPELLRKADIYFMGIHKRIPTLDSSVTIWLPNSYSDETAKLAEEMIQNSQKIGNLTFDRKPVEYHKYGAIAIHLKPRKKYGRSNLFDEYKGFSKTLYFIPEIPHIENGELIEPINAKGKKPLKMAIVSSLNYFPFKLRMSSSYDYSCFLRQIEPQWFLRMCPTPFF